MCLYLTQYGFPGSLLNQVLFTHIKSHKLRWLLGFFPLRSFRNYHWLILYMYGEQVDNCVHVREYGLIIFYWIGHQLAKMCFLKVREPGLSFGRGSLLL